jgi:hypothetical protein
MLPKVSPENFNLIRSGRKGALLFLGPRIFVLGKSTLTCSDPRLAPITIEVSSLTVKYASTLDEADQRDLGFATFQRLVEHMADTAPDLEHFDPITIVRFHR